MIKSDEIGGTHRTQGQDEKRIQHFGRKA